MKDLIDRQAAIRRYCGEHCGCEPQDCGLTMLQDGSEDCDFVRFLKEEPSAEPEQLTDNEQRIFLAAMAREEKVCRQVDDEYRNCREPYEDSLVRICHEITRKVKGALWTI